MLDDQVLIVDDDPEILKSFQRSFAGKLNIDTAASGEKGLEAVSKRGPYAVVVSDYRMPGLDGIQFLARVKHDSPDTVRILLTGHADLKTAIEAVNEGEIFRLLTKPCPSSVVTKSLLEGIKQYRLVIAERELLENTLSGSLKVLTDLLSLVKPDAFGRGSRITSWASKIAESMNLSHEWEIPIAASLSQIGLIVLPEPLIRRINKGRRLSLEEEEAFYKHPSLTAGLIANIPRLEKVSKIIAYQEKHYDGSGAPEDSIRGEEIPLGARVLKAAIDFDALIGSGLSKSEALAEMKRSSGRYDPNVLAALTVVLGEEAKYGIKEVAVLGLKEKMVLAEDVFTISPRMKLLAKGQELSGSIIEYIKRFNETFGVRQPIKVILSTLIK